jgi:hypothetical protein
MPLFGQKSGQARNGRCYEVDFLAQSARGEKRLLQVAWNIDNSNTHDREMRALEAAQKELGIAGELVTIDTYLSECWKSTVS